MKRIKDFSFVGKALTKVLAKKITFHPASDNMQEILADYPQLVVALNHGPMLGPLATTIALNKLYSENGGGDRKPIAIMWRLFYQIPLYKYAIQYITQVDRGLNFDEFLDKMENGGFTDLLVKPEGENCNYGNGLDIEPFLSPRFIEFALRLNVPVLVMVHQGSEQWGTTLPVSSKLDPLLKKLPKKSYDRIRETRLLNIPKLTHRLKELKVMYKLYQPEITLADLPEDLEQRKALIAEESEKVRTLMQSMIDTLKQG
ncbi:hypothetical protein [Litoribrevibacter albus]|uniref:Uncharacterized protein n=1 Tax=Litoribrevibacter albus TaxID=1473156 RepID=A0AA37SG10_9GAMM|nr:hypothetical protein [Litoribrevibacter albus]GLQ33589.1 hypothetical protein GCM10007876_40690 [Litoribrevibacter albus]